MKKILTMCLMLATLSLSACSTGQTEQISAFDNGKTNIVATSFHEYDWVREILGENDQNIEVMLLMNSGVDLHSYEPTVHDISKASSADLFIYNGGLSDTWVDDIIENPINSEQKTVKVSEVLADYVKMEVTVEGMQETEDSHDHGNQSLWSKFVHFFFPHDHDHEDEHLWLSLNNAILVCEALTENLCQLDAENSEFFQENCENYIEKLKKLDVEYKNVAENSFYDTLIFPDRFPFLYLMSDYDINYYAAFSGCSAETEASFETVVFLAEKINEQDVNYVLIIDNGLVDLANTVISNSQKNDCEILTLNSIQSVNQEAIDSGITYYSIMKDNLNVLTTALSE